MECKIANDFMNLHMDGALNEADSAALQAHLEVCENCVADFAAYSEILEGFGDLEIIEAPEGFADAVMARVSELDIYSPKAAPAKKARFIDNLVFALLPITAVAISVMAILLVYRYEAHEALLANGWYAAAGIFETAAFAAVDFISGVMYNISLYLNWLTQYVTRHSWLLL
ncbi:MAG: zf-HC2 domain-containing protein, partial [Defluviitaleaceae bacterium]|nr:zf-HC2 domain-containing protein [Defluviitaleaceae bacterium]